MARLIARKYAQHPEYGIRLVGLADDTPQTVRGELAEIPTLAMGDIVDVIGREGVERVVITFTEPPDPKLSFVKE